MQMVFQNPSSSFNSRLRVGDSLLEPLACFPEKRNAILERKGLTLQQYAEELMGLVQLDPCLLGSCRVGKNSVLPLRAP